jgi:chromosome segregation ATPase
MAKTTDLTVQILKEIRDAVKQTNVRLEQTNVRLDQTREELSAELTRTREELSARIDKVEGAVLELATQQRFMVKEIQDLRSEGQSIRSGNRGSARAPGQNREPTRP